MSGERRRNYDVEMKQMVKDIRSRRDEVEKLKYKRKWYRMRRFRGKEKGNCYEDSTVYVKEKQCVKYCNQKRRRSALYGHGNGHSH